MAEDRGMKSISFPTIGTGKLGFPKALVAQLLYGEILKFSQKRQTKRVTDMTIMLYPGDTETHQVTRGCNFDPAAIGLEISQHSQQGFLYCGNIGKEL